MNSSNPFVVAKNPGSNNPQTVEFSRLVKISLYMTGYIYHYIENPSFEPRSFFVCLFDKLILTFSNFLPQLSTLRNLFLGSLVQHVIVSVEVATLASYNSWFTGGISWEAVETTPDVSSQHSLDGSSLDGIWTTRT